MKCLPVLLVALGAALWVLAANQILPIADWSPPSYAADGLTIAEIRLAFGLMPRAVMALLVGAALGLSGALMQRVLRNPLADPTVLGVSTGAQLALVCATLFAPQLLLHGRLPVALFGAGSAATIVFALSARRGFEPAQVVIAGMLVGLMASSLATALTLAQGQYLLSLVIWNGGSLVQQDWSGVLRMGLILLLALSVALGLQRALQLLSMGGETASSLGVNVGLVRLAVMGVATLVASAVSAEVGLIGFVGLAAPTIVRSMRLRSEVTRILASMATGAGLLFFCDSALLALSQVRAEMFPVGAVTGLIGGPLLLWLLPRLAGRQPPASQSFVASVTAVHSWRRIFLLLAVVLTGALAFLLVGRGPAGWTLLEAADLRSFLPLRLPRLVAALSAGALLAGAGAILQRLTANPLASPEVMGVSGGAALGYGAAIFLFQAPAAGTTLLFSALGSLIVLAIIARVSMRGDTPPERVLLAGLAISALASAVLSAMMSGGDARAWAILDWLAGSATAITPLAAAGLLVLAFGLAVVSLLATRWLAILPLGSELSNTLGLPRAAQLGLIVAAGVASGTATVFVGPISFVGLMAPHIARSMGLVRPAQFITGSIAIGALLMMLADAGARFATFPYELPLGLFATLLGTPWLLLQMMRNSR